MVKSDKMFLKGEVSARRRLWLIRGAFFLFLLIMLVFLLAAFEFSARWYYRDILSTSHGRDYFFIKSHDLRRAEKNSLGFRGGELPGRTKTYRIVVLGDSFTWGQGIYPYTSRFPELAEKLFKERYPGADIEVINVGVPGNNLREHNNFLPFIINLDPDFVLYQWYVNDMEKQVDVAAFHAETLMPQKGWHLALMNNSVTYIISFRAWNQLRTFLGMQKTYNRYLVDKMHDPDSGPSLWAGKALHELVTGIQGRGITTGIVLFPQCSSNMAGYELGFLHERVLAECRRDNITCLDLRQAYSAFDGKMQDLRASPLDAHPSKLAHRIAAEQIVETFGPLWQEALTKRSTAEEGR